MMRAVRLVALRASARSLSAGETRRYKIYEEVENAHFYETVKALRPSPVVASSNAFAVTSRDGLLELLSRRWNDASPTELCDAFASMSSFAAANRVDITGGEFDAFVDALADATNEMSDDEIERTFASLGEWPEVESVHSRNFVEVWSALDDALVRRSAGWERDRALRFADRVCRLGLARKSNYVHVALGRLTRGASSLSVSQLVGTLYVALLRRSAPQRAMVGVEERLRRLADRMTIEQVGVACAGFFKTRSTFKNEEFVSRLMRRVADEAATIDELALCSVLKALRNSSRIVNCDAMGRMLDALTPQVGRLSLMSCVQLVLVCLPINYRHRASYDAVAEKFLSDVSVARSKDLERLALAFASFRHGTDDRLYAAIADELVRPERACEFAKYPKCFSYCLSYLAIVDNYPLDLIKLVVNDRFFMTHHKRSALFLPSYNQAGKELVVLTNSIKIERPSYDGEYLSDELCTRIASRCIEQFPKPHNSNIPLQNAILDIIFILQKLKGGEEFVFPLHVLPHFHRGDIIVANDLTGNPVNVKNIFFKAKFGKIHYPPECTHKFYAFIVVGKYCVTANTGEEMGLVVMKNRQLRKIGYIPVQLHWHDWVQLNNEEEKFIYIQNKVKQSEDFYF